MWAYWWTDVLIVRNALNPLVMQNNGTIFMECQELKNNCQWQFWWQSSLASTDTAADTELCLSSGNSQSSLPLQQSEWCHISLNNSQCSIWAKHLNMISLFHWTYCITVRWECTGWGGFGRALKHKEKKVSKFEKAAMISIVWQLGIGKGSDRCWMNKWWWCCHVERLQILLGVLESTAPHHWGQSVLTTAC